MSVTLIKPNYIFSSSFNFFAEGGEHVGSICMPLLAKLLKSNTAQVLSEGKAYTLVDAITVVGGYVGSGQRSTNTYLKQEEKKLVELTYQNQGENQRFVVTHLESNRQFEVYLNGFGTFRIQENGEVIGNLLNKELLLRRARLDLKISIPLTVQILIFWGSINTQNVV